MNIPSIKVMLVDDHAVVRSGLRRLIENHSNIQVVAEAVDGEQAYQLYSAQPVDVVVMDLSMPGMGGLESARRIIGRYATAKIIIFSMHDNATFAAQVLKTGVKGYVTKTGSDSDLLKAIQEVAHGRNYLSSEVAQKIALESMGGEENPLKMLSAREFEVFRLLTQGVSAEEVGERLKISQKTVSNYYTMIKQKLGANSPIEMVRIAIRHGIIDG
jgi:two-component system, NarL family, invasion response regulator UvrY